MARAIWSGAISFGLVNIPVRLYTAIAHKEVRFHMLHGKDGGRISFKRWCSVEDKEVPYGEIVKGYEISKGRFVMIDPAELERLYPKSTHTIDIEDFVLLKEIDPIFFDTSYHVAPDERGGKAYAMLVRAMEKSGKVAVARMVLRTRQYLCAVRADEGRLLLSTMQYADEIVQATSLDIPRAEAAQERELLMAQHLIESLTTHFKPDKYKDDFRERVLELVEKKAAGEEIVAPERPERIGVANLADALAASLEAARRPRAGERRAPPARNHRMRPAARTRRAR